jgi:hypothetical protein
MLAVKYWHFELLASSAHFYFQEKSCFHLAQVKKDLVRANVRNEARTALLNLLYNVVIGKEFIAITSQHSINPLN